MSETEVEEYLAEKLAKYLRSHYGIFAPELLEIVLKKNNLGILHLITVAGELTKFAKENGFEPTMNIVETSPRKVRGFHPLASNIV